MLLVLFFLHICTCSFSLLAKYKKNYVLSTLRARKSDIYRYRNSWKNDNYRETNKAKKQRTITKNEAKKIKNDNFTKSNRERSNIAIAMLENRLF